MKAPVTLLLWANLAVSGVPASGPLVTAYPSGASVPENLLRIELRFSVPLNGTLDMRFVRLLDSDGKDIKGPFLDLPLPSADGSSMTLLLHPGRVKSGVGANVALGRALQAGSKVTLVVDDPKFAHPLRKSWQVVAADLHPPEPARWIFRIPEPGGRSQLLVQLDAPVASSGDGLIAIRSPDGSRVAGTASLLNGETTWCFIPKQPWQPGRFAIVAHPGLEDSAGNRICRPFESEAFRGPECAPGASRPFRIRAQQLSGAGEIR